MILDTHRILELVALQANLESADGIELSSKLIDDLGYDSLDLVEIVMKMEKAFQIYIPDEDMERIVTVQDVVDMVKKYLNLKIA